MMVNTMHIENWAFIDGNISKVFKDLLMFGLHVYV